MSPKERAPWTNLSAAFFELGDYAKAISACDTALALLDPTAQDYDHLKQKHVVRRVKSCLFLARYKDVAAAIVADQAAVDTENMLPKCAELYADVAERIVEHINARNEVILNLPRYKPTLYVLLLFAAFPDADAG